LSFERIQSLTIYHHRVSTFMLWINLKYFFCLRNQLYICENKTSMFFFETRNTHSNYQHKKCFHLWWAFFFLSFCQNFMISAWSNIYSRNHLTSSKTKKKEKNMNCNVMPVMKYVFDSFSTKRSTPYNITESQKVNMFRK